MVIKIKTKKTASVIRQQRIDADNITAVSVRACQMRHQYALVQRYPAAVWAGYALDLLPVDLGADTVLPQVFADREITGFPVFHHGAPGVHIVSPAEQRKKNRAWAGVMTAGTTAVAVLNNVS